MFDYFISLFRLLILIQVFVLIIAVFKNPDFKKNHVFLLVFFISLFMDVLNDLLDSNIQLFNFTYLNILTFSFFTLLGPSIFLYTKSLIKVIKWYDYFHFIPFVVILSNLTVIYFINTSKLNSYQKTNEDILVNLAVDSSIFLYLFMAHKYFNKLKNESIYLYQKIHWLKKIFIILYFMLAVTTIEHLLGFTNIALSDLILALVFIYLNYRVFQEQAVHNFLKNENKILKSGGTYDKYQIKEYIIKQGIYKDKNLSLEKLAEILKLTTHECSHIINNYYHLNFYHFINQIRVDEICRILTESNQCSAFEIAESCGFNSKSTFYAAFKKFKNHSPNDYLKKLNPNRVN